MLVLRYSRKFFAYFFLTAAFLDSVYAGDPSPSEPSVVKPKPPVVQPDVKPEPPFVKGEELEYKVYYSFIHAGTATMSVDEDLHSVGDHLCYKIKVRGESSKALGLLGFKVDDSWETYLDAGCSNPLRPHRCITHLQENGYERKEKVDFDYQLNKAKIEVAESSRNMETEVTYHPIPHAKIKDLIGGYYDLRSIDTTKLKPGDKLTVTVLHDQQLYENIDIEFLGTKTLTMKLGKTSALVFAPLVPIEGTIFSGERPVKTYISNDVNKVPLKLEVNLFIGGVEIELTDYKGLKEPIHFQPS